jgi:hypothetical protein
VNIAMAHKPLPPLPRGKESHKATAFEQVRHNTPLFLFSQQISFGRKRTKQWWPKWWQGIANFCMQGLKVTGSPGKKIAAQVLSALQGKGLVRKEASLLRAFLVTFFAKK